MMMMKSVIRWRKPEYPEESTDLRQVTEEKKNIFHKGENTWLTVSTIWPRFTDLLQVPRYIVVVLT